jgi:DNA polymerase-3 subunit beta
MPKSTPILDRFSIDCASLNMAMNPLLSVVPRKSPKPILQNILLSIDPEHGSYLSATDLEVGVRLQLVGVKADVPGSIILPTTKLHQILRQAKGEILFDPTSSRVTLRGERFKFELALEDPDLYPIVPTKSLVNYHEILAADLLRGIARTKYATDVESTRYALGGLLVQCLLPEQMTFVATDGRRLAKQLIPASEFGTGAHEGNPVSTVIPLKAVILLERLVDASDPPVKIGFDGNNAVFFQTYNATVYSRLVEGRFPAYENIFPASLPIKIALTAGDFKDALQLASITTSEESRGVDCSITPGQIRLSGSASETGFSEIDVLVGYGGSPITVSFDPRYLIDMLSAIPDSMAISMEIETEKSAIVFKTEDDLKYAVMPLTRDR